MRHSIHIIYFVGFFLSIAVPITGQDKVLFSIDDEDVTLSEFKYIYEKNNRDQAD